MHLFLFSCSWIISILILISSTNSYAEALNYRTEVRPGYQTRSLLPRGTSRKTPQASSRATSPAVTHSSSPETASQSHERSGASSSSGSHGRSDRKPAVMRLELSGDVAKSYMKTPGKSHEVPPKGGFMVHHRQVQAGATISGPQQGTESRSAVVIASGDKVQAQLHPGKHTNGGYMSVPRPWGLPDRLVQVKPGDRHTHVSTNSGQGEPLRLMAGMKGKGSVHADAKVIHGRE